MAKYLPFLKSVWTVFSIDPQKVQSIWMDKWVDEQVYLSLGEFTSVDELSRLCEIKNVTDKSFERTIKSLNEYWSQFSATAKNALIEIIKIHNLEHLVNFELQLTSEEQEELKIRWDISDILYLEKKQEAIELYKEIGLDLEKGDIIFPKASSLSKQEAFPEMMDNCTKLILSALKYKLELDLAVASIATDGNSQRHAKIIKGRLKSEYINFLGDLEASLIVLITDFPDLIGHMTEITAEHILRFAVCNAAKRNAGYVAIRATKLILDLGVGKEFEKLLSEIPEIQLSSDVYSRVQKMIESNG